VRGSQAVLKVEKRGADWVSRISKHARQASHFFRLKPASARKLDFFSRSPPFTPCEFRFPRCTDREDNRRPLSVLTHALFGAEPGVGAVVLEIQSVCHYNASDYNNIPTPLLLKWSVRATNQSSAAYGCVGLEVVAKRCYRSVRNWRT
jgi:hypothetical protein